MPPISDSATERGGDEEPRHIEASDDAMEFSEALAKTVGRAG